MKRALLLFLAAGFAFGAYQGYYYIDPLTSVDTTKWYKNGIVSATPSGLTSTSASGGSLISKLAVPDGTSDYHVSTDLRLPMSGGTYYHYLRASADAKAGPTPTGSFYSVELRNPTFNGSSCTATLAVQKRVGGVLTLLASTTIPCYGAMDLVSIIRGNRIQVWAVEVWYLDVTDSSLPAGQPGVGVQATPFGNVMTPARLGVLDRVAPSPVDAQSIGTSVYPYSVDMQWQEPLDDPNGLFVWHYLIYRDGQLMDDVSRPEYTDESVAPSTTYTYAIQAQDMHLNSAPATTFTVTTPPYDATNQRRVGVRPTGAYWGAGGEQIDVFSGNLNFSLPLLDARGRGNWSETFSLSYNSQLWRKDPGGTWKLGRDVGFGYGWRLQAGSLTPFWQDSFTIHHYTYVDSTGAEYRLDRYANGLWSSGDGIYLTYNPVTLRLYSNDGSFWVMGSLSTGNEQDAGTRYPTLMQDSNGNQVIIRYGIGVGVGWENTCARIKEIEDVRATQDPSPPYTWRSYKFTYNTDPLPHLTQIDFHMGVSKSYTFTYLANQPLNSPFSPPQSFGTTHLLRTVTDPGLGLTHTFSYGANSSGELTQVDFPYGGHLRWDHREYAFTDGRTLREVEYRYLAQTAGGAETTVTMTRNGSEPYHGAAFLDDPAGGGMKVWTLMSCGLVSSYYERPALFQQDKLYREYTWVNDAQGGNGYIGSLLTVLDPGKSYEARSKLEQTLDQFGNVTQSKIYNYGDLVTPARTYTNTYLTGTNYSSRFINNRLVSSVVSDGTNQATLLINTYDSTSLTNRTGLREHDTGGYGTGFTYRGNVTRAVASGLTTNIFYDITGALASADDNNGHTVAVAPAAGTNNAAPGTVTPNGNTNLTESYTWSAFLGLNSETAPNNATSSVAYDTYARPSSTTSAHGATTTYTYVTSAPASTTATTNGRWVKTTYDGLGRTIKVESGDGTGTKSVVETEYAPCACSPLGKVKRVSQPYAPGGTVYWTTNAWDCTGRTTAVTHPDGSVTTYLYEGNTVKITDPAGKWKKYTMDAMGNLVKVTEPDPGGGADVDTLYAFNVRSQLTTVTMTRSGTTQTRTFNYDLATGRLMSAANPENGTVTYTYNAEGLIATKTDARNQQVQYSYDSYHRLTQVRRYPVAGGTEDACQRVDLYHDTNPFSPAYGVGAYGRLAATRFGGTSCITGEWKEMYSYTNAGRPTRKRLDKTNGTLTMLEASYGWDNEGKLTSVAYPNGGKTYTYTYDTMARPVKLRDNTGIDWAKDGLYGPAGELTQIKYTSDGTNANYHTETRSYNSLLQLTRLTVPGVIDHEYRYPAAQNNGRISQRMDYVSGEEVTYQYDSLSRLISAATTGPEWGQSFVYDGFGNLTDQVVTKGSAPSLAVLVNPANNRITTGGYSYDANGSLSAMPLLTLNYDVDNRLVEATHSSNGTDQYRYAPDNTRFWKKRPDGTERIYFYGVDGVKLGEYSLSGSTFTTKKTSIYFAGKLIWAEGVAAVTDRLGSVVSQGWKYFPYGEEPATTTLDRTKFATYYRDETTALDYANQRYYARTIGRFLTVDPFCGSAILKNPQTFNRYSYVVGDPVNFNDPSGLERCRDIGVLGTTQKITDLLDTSTDLGLLATTVFVESAMKDTPLGSEEMSAIAAVILNRYNVVNGHVEMVRQDGSIQQAPGGWGVADGTLRAILNPSQFEVWQGNGSLTDSAKSRLDFALGAGPDSGICRALLNAIGTGHIMLPKKDTNTIFVSTSGLMFSGFNSFNYEQKYDWEELIGSFGSANKFYGVRLPIPVPIKRNQPVDRTRRDTGRAGGRRR